MKHEIRRNPPWGWYSHRSAQYIAVSNVLGTFTFSYKKYSERNLQHTTQPERDYGCYDAIPHSFTQKLHTTQVFKGGQIFHLVKSVLPRFYFHFPWHILKHSISPSNIRYIYKSSWWVKYTPARSFRHLCGNRDNGPCFLNLTDINRLNSDYRTQLAERRLSFWKCIF